MKQKEEQTWHFYYQLQDNTLKIPMLLVKSKPQIELVFNKIF
jgi:hypothetical protein